MLSQLVSEKKLEAARIGAYRRRVAERVLRESAAMRDADFTTINTRDLFEMFTHYDDLFFDGELARKLDRPDHLLKFRLSSRMTSTGGMTTSYRSAGQGARRQFEIAISTTLLFNTSFSGEPVQVGGVPTTSRIDALQRIFEHELVHLLEMMLWDDSSCARPRFKSIVGRFFDHRESNHQLLTPAETARNEFGIVAGELVRFHYQGETRQGFVNSIHRRATVLVPDESGELFSDRRRYRKYYVPIDKLTRVTRKKARSKR